ncbi:hypothetical protein [Paenibacillus albidus]|uniref:hypothetical protein n=1 Tax=Paenibacillus albidus TaxID=2041023 RepID=UPI001663C08B|nr:hypothetical protein [Paenibacillus albidus]
MWSWTFKIGKKISIKGTLFEREGDSGVAEEDSEEGRTLILSTQAISQKNSRME